MQQAYTLLLLVCILHGPISPVSLEEFLGRNLMLIIRAELSVSLEEFSLLFSKNIIKK